MQQRASGSCSNIKTIDAACRYTDHSFDAEFITLLRDVCIGYLRRTPEATLEEILDFVLEKVGLQHMTQQRRSWHRHLQHQLSQLASIEYGVHDSPDAKQLPA